MEYLNWMSIILVGVWIFSQLGLTHNGLKLRHNGILNLVWLGWCPGGDAKSAYFVWNNWWPIWVKRNYSMFFQWFSVDELRKLLNDKEAYNRYFLSLDQIKTQNNVSIQLILYWNELLFACFCNFCAFILEFAHFKPQSTSNTLV